MALPKLPKSPRIKILPNPSEKLPEYLQFQTAQFSPYFGAEIPLREKTRTSATIDFTVSSIIVNRLTDVIQKFRKGYEFNCEKIKVDLDADLT